MKYKSYLLIFSLCVGLIFTLFAEPKKGPSKIRIDNADLISFNEDLDPGVQTLTGNVRFYHGNTLMTCDSAKYNSAQNSFFAQGNVYVNEGDTITLHSRYMRYIGDQKLIKAYGDVVLVNKTMTIITDTLDYDRAAQKAYYFNKAKITDDPNILTSEIGVYRVEDNIVDFYLDVVGTNPDFVLTTDTLSYHTQTKVMAWQGPTDILSKKNKISSKRGVYYTLEEVVDFSNEPKIFYDNRLIKGDSIHYERNNGYAKIIKNVEILDSTARCAIFGNIAEYFEKQDSAIVPERPRIAYLMDKDTLYARSDTLTVTRKISTELNKQDTTYVVNAYRNVRYFKSDMAGISDSLSSNNTTGVLSMFYDPVMFSGENQITGDTIIIKRDMIAQKLDSIWIKKKAFIISQDKRDPSAYNQIYGNNIRGKFIEDDLRQIYILGNAQTIYYPATKDPNEEIGTNKTTGPYIYITLRDSEVQRIKFLKQTSGTLHVNKLTDEEKHLNGFKLRDTDRPRSKENILGEKELEINLRY